MNYQYRYIKCKWSFRYNSCDLYSRTGMLDISQHVFVSSKLEYIRLP